jgi:hypothetical protein
MEYIYIIIIKKKGCCILFQFNKIIRKKYNLKAKIIHTHSLIPKTREWKPLASVIFLVPPSYILLKQRAL